MSRTFSTVVGDASATSYATLQDATDYMEIRPGASSWFAYDQSVQERYLMYATGMMDRLAEYDGTIADSTNQALRWPRVEAYDCDGIEQDSTSIPLEVKEAAVEFAFYLTEDDRLAIPDLIGQGFSEAKVGPLAVKVRRNLRFSKASDNVNYTLGCLGTITRGNYGGVSSLVSWRA